MNNICTIGFNHNPIFVARQPIFDRDRNVFCHEILFRYCADDQCVTLIDDDQATGQVVADGFSLAEQQVSSSSAFIIKLSKIALLDGTVLALPSNRVIVEPPRDYDSDSVDALKNLKERGYPIMIRNNGDSVVDSPLLELADMISVSFQDNTPQHLLNIKKTLNERQMLCIASKLQSWEEFEAAKAMRFDYFQGFFFQRPIITEGKRLNSNDSIRFKLVGELAHPDIQSAELAATISCDPGLSHRLLRYVNSTSFSFRRQVESIQQACTLVGLTPLRHWAMAAIVAETDTSPKGQELAYLGLSRARFLYLLSSQMKSSPLPLDTMYTLGLFSRIDAMLGLPFEVILDQLPLSSDFEDALLGRNVAASRLLRILDDIEKGDPNTPIKVVQSIGVAPAHMAALYLKACSWASDLLSR